ncbi:MAG: hypothetical protein K2Y05_00120 [Hyphomicrobiaceae bacterium]|nr:hypothetical protein [Hyphomicrobiaceae bacterium]
MPRIATPLVGMAIAALLTAPVLAADTVPGAGGLNPGGNSAHAIAERFARAAAGAGEANASATADPAKAKAKSDAAKATADAALDAARRRATEARRKVEATARKAAEQRRIDEADMLARARGEAEAREAEARLAEAESRAADANVRAAEAEAVRIAADADRAQQAADAATAATEQKRADEDEKRAEEMRKVQQAEREAETLRIVEKLRAARAAKAAEAEQLEAANAARARAAGTGSVLVTAPTADPTVAHPASGQPSVAPPSVSTATTTVVVAGPSPTVAAPAVAAPTASAPAHASTLPPTAALAGRATVILVLATGGRGIGRNGTTTADPVLCLGGTCYVGQGSAEPSTEMPRHVALGPGNTLGQRAGACARSLTCVFRNVEIASGTAEFQPVDLRLLRHDRRDVAVGSVDASCNTTSGVLICGKPVTSATWTAWIVPEPVASAAGPAILAAAASTKLDGRTAAAH